MGKPNYRRLTFAKALEWMRRKVPMPTGAWDEMTGAAQQWAFTIAGVTQVQALQEVLNLTTKAVDEGMLYKDFKEQFSEAWERRGFSPLRDWRMRLVLMQNLRNSYAAGRYQQQMDPATKLRRPYLVYRHGDPITPRPHHAALDGFTAAADDPVWNSLYAPNGFNCSCRIYSMNARQLAQEGLSLSDPLPMVQVTERGGDRSVRVPAVNIDGRLTPVAEPGFEGAPWTESARGTVLQNALKKIHPQLVARLNNAN
jgi:hypothetical protein